MSGGAVRRRPRGRGGHGLKSWNFWTPIYGTVYGVYGWHRGRVCYIYGGKTTQVPWTKRLEDHLWGRHHRNAQQAWAHTVLGWRPNGTIEEVIAAGGVTVLWQAQTVPLVLSVVEVVWAIRWRRPVHNHQHNTLNPRRSTYREAQQLRRAQQAANRGGQPIHLVARRETSAVPGLVGAAVWVFLAVFGLVMFLPGQPGAVAVHDAWLWINAHAVELIALALLAAGTGVTLTRAVSRPRPRRKRRTRRR